jgi:Alginate export
VTYATSQYRNRYTLPRAAAITTTLLAAALRLGAQVPATLPVPITLFGEIRSRSEWDRPGGAVDADAYAYLRTRIGLRAAPADGVAIVLQFQDRRVYGINSSSAENNPDAFDLHQAYVALSTRWRTLDLAARVGRQEVAFGNERLVGPVGWSNAGRTFDGARLLLTPATALSGKELWTLTAFAATVDERGRHFAATTPASGTNYPSDHAVVGVFATRALAGAALDATLLFDGAANYRAYSGSDRVTADARLRSGTTQSFGIELEGAIQAGHQHAQPIASSAPVSQSVAAWMGGARAGRFPMASRRTSAIVGADLLSGDGSPVDGTYTAFNTMYATNHPFYGRMDLFLDPAARTKDAGLVDLFASAASGLDTPVAARVDIHRFAPQAGNSREIGWELDAIVPVKLSKAVDLELGYGAFRASSGADVMGLGQAGSTRHWAYAQLRAAF